MYSQASAVRVAHAVSLLCTRVRYARIEEGRLHYFSKQNLNLMPPSNSFPFVLHSSNMRYVSRSVIGRSFGRIGMVNLLLARCSKTKKTSKLCIQIELSLSLSLSLFLFLSLSHTHTLSLVFIHAHFYACRFPPLPHHHLHVTVGI